VGVLVNLVSKDQHFRSIQCQLTREAASLRVTIRMGQTGRYLDRRRAVLPL
jgi:hypothetical protein